MDGRGGETEQLRCGCGCGCWMRNEGKQLDPPKACQNRVGQEQVTDWRGGGGGSGQAPPRSARPLLQLVDLATSLGYHGPGRLLAESCKQHTIQKNNHN